MFEIAMNASVFAQVLLFLLGSFLVLAVFGTASTIAQSISKARIARWEAFARGQGCFVDELKTMTAEDSDA